MSTSKLDALKALFRKEKENKEKNGSGGKRGNMYPFWEMQVNQRATIRLLPDKNQDNPYIFFIDKLEHTLSIDGKNVNVPCLKMYGEKKCPICDLSRDFYKAEGNKSQSGKYYFRKKTSIARVLVLEDPLDPDPETGEQAVGKTLNTQLGYQLMEKIKEEIASETLESDPWDIHNGYDFIIKKSAQGDYGTYAIASGFARRPSPIPKQYLDSIELIDLSTVLPKNPGYDAVKRQLDAHLNGTEVEGDDKEKQSSQSSPKPHSNQTPKNVPLSRNDDNDDDDDDDDDHDDNGDSHKEPSTSNASPSSADDEEDDILAQLRNRKRNK